MKNIVVFDFDKTLIYNDSLTEIFKKEIGYRYHLLVVYFLFKFLSKFGIISVKKEKELMLRFLFNSNKDRFDKACIDFAKSVEFTPVISKLRECILSGDRVILLSATYEKLLVYLFPNIEIIGLKLDLCGNKIKGISQHPYSMEKYNLLIENNIVNIDFAYFDSKKDEVIIPLCKKWFKVVNGEIIS